MTGIVQRVADALREESRQFRRDNRSPGNYRQDLARTAIALVADDCAKIARNNALQYDGAGNDFERGGKAAASDIYDQIMALNEPTP